MPWPIDTDNVDNTNFQADDGVVTGTAPGARAELLDLIAKFNAILGSCPSGSTPITDQTDAAYMLRVASNQTNNAIALLDNTTGAALTSNKTMATSVTDTDATVPTSKAVKTYADNLLGALAPYQAACIVTGTTTFTPMPNGNVVSITYSSPRYRVNFTTPFASTAYVAQFTAYDATLSAGYSIKIQTVNVAYIEFVVYRTDDGSTSTCDAIHFAAWGAQ